MSEVRDWSLRFLCRLRATPEQIWWIRLKKLINQLRLKLNVERSWVYINPCGTLCDYVCVF